MHTLIVDPDKKRLLQNTGWCVSKVHAGSQRPHARASAKAPGVRKGQLLHRLVTRVDKKRRVRALDGNLLNSTKTNLQECSRSAIAIMNRRARPEKLVGVTYTVAPKWMKTTRFWSAALKVDGVRVHLGNWRTREESAAAFDRAARYLYGKNAVTNESLGLIASQVVATRACRKAAKEARDRLVQHLGRATLQKIVTFLSSKATLASIQEVVRRPTEQPVAVKCFDTGKVARGAEPKAEIARREKAERRAARKLRKVAKQSVMRRRQERAAAAMAAEHHAPSDGINTVSRRTRHPRNGQVNGIPVA